jgi:hypothetical protein
MERIVVFIVAGFELLILAAFLAAVGVWASVAIDTLHIGFHW